MRICLITPGFSAGEEDWAIPALLALVRALARRHAVHVLALRYPHHRAPYRLDEISVQPLGYGRAAGLQRLPLLLRGLGHVLAHHRRQPFDVIHGLWADEPGFLAVMAARLLHRRGVVSLLGGELANLPDTGYGGQLSRANRMLINQALRRAHVVTAGSETLLELARARVGRDRLYRMPLGVDTDLFRPDGPAAELAGGFKLLHVASLSPVKDQGTLLAAVAAANIPELHLHIVGTGPLQNRLQAQAADLGIAARITWHGHLPQAALPALYRGADLFALSSRFESQNLAALEAASCGCALIGTAVGVLPELCAAEQLAAPGDVAGLARVLRRACGSSERRRTWAGTARQRVLEQYTLVHTLERLESLYRGA